MTCPLCGEKTVVKDTGTYSDIIIRKRQCQECKYVFFTKELDYDNYKEAQKLLLEARKAK